MAPAIQSFPIYLMNHVIKNFLDKQYITNATSPTVPKLLVLLSFPYLGSCSVHLNKKPRKFLGNIYPLMEFRFIFQSVKRIENFFPFKDHVASNLRSSVVYKFTCSSCKARVQKKVKPSSGSECFTYNLPHYTTSV